MMPELHPTPLLLKLCTPWGDGAALYKCWIRRQNAEQASRVSCKVPSLHCGRSHVHATRIHQHCAFTNAWEHPLNHSTLTAAMCTQHQLHWKSPYRQESYVSGMLMALLGFALFIPPRLIF